MLSNTGAEIDGHSIEYRKSRAFCCRDIPFCRCCHAIDDDICFSLLLHTLMPLIRRYASTCRRRFSFAAIPAYADATVHIIVRHTPEDVYAPPLCLPRGALIFRADAAKCGFSYYAFDLRCRFRWYIFSSPFAIFRRFCLPRSAQLIDADHVMRERATQRADYFSSLLFLIAMPLMLP